MPGELKEVLPEHILIYSLERPPTLEEIDRISLFFDTVQINFTTHEVAGTTVHWNIYVKSYIFPPMAEKDYPDWLKDHVTEVQKYKNEQKGAKNKKSP